MELNVTSFVDIIFNLLVFFILSTSFATGATSAGLVVELPAAAQVEREAARQDLVIALLRDGQVVVDGAGVSLAALPARVLAWKAQAQDGMVIVQADAEVPHGKVVEVIDQVKAQGIARVVIAAQGG